MSSHGEFNPEKVAQDYWKHLGLTEFNANQQAEHVGLLKWLAEWIEVKHDYCRHCGGSGDEPDSERYYAASWMNCVKCGGSGNDEWAEKIQRVDSPEFRSEKK